MFWARLPGRGMYVAADREAIEKAAAKGLFCARRQAAGDGAASAGRLIVERQLARRVVESDLAGAQGGRGGDGL